MLYRRKLLASVLVAALLATGCLRQAAREVAQSFNQLTAVRNELIKQFGDEVNVNLSKGTNQLLTVTFVNSNLNAGTRIARYMRAESAAQIVRATYGNFARLDGIWVGFALVQTRLIFFKQTQMFDLFRFDRNAAPLTIPDESFSSSGGVELQTSASYLSESDESDISVSGIQLDGRPGGLGITVLPHFRVNGDARIAPTSPPQTVSFYFASFSEKPRFAQMTSITFIGDGKEILSVDGTFTGNDAQFCNLPISYSAFRKIIAANGLTIRLGREEFPLTYGQFAGVKRMAYYLRD